MKKFLVILMVVAMASFLFVGCLGVTPSVDDVDDVDDVVDVAKTDTPYITAITSISLSSTATQYTKDPQVSGVGVAGAVIKVYIDGVQSGVGNTGVGGVFEPISVSMITLTEGVRKLYVTATVPGLAESDKSTEYTFTYDKTAPKIASAIADSSDGFITVTFDEAVNTKAAATVPVAAPLFLNSALNILNWNITVNTVTVTVANFVATSSKVIRITPTTPALGAAGTLFTLSVTGIGDSLGTLIKPTAPSTYVGVVTD